MMAMIWAQGFLNLTLENPQNSRWGQGLGFQGKSRSIQGLRLLKFQGCFEDFPWKSSNFKARTRITFSMILQTLPRNFHWWHFVMRLKFLKCNPPMYERTDRREVVTCYLDGNLPFHKGPGWGHRKIVDWAETLPSETFEHI